MSNQDTTEDPRVAAEEALRIVADVGNEPIEQLRFFLPTAKADFIARSRALLPILARALIEGQAERDTMRAALTAIGFPRQGEEPLTDTFARAWGWSVEMAHKAQASADAARAELASLRARTAPLTERQARKVWSEAMWQRSEDDTLEAVAIRCIVAASRRAIPPEVRAETASHGDPFTPDEAAEIIASAPGQIAPGQQPIGFADPVDVPPTARRRTGVFGERVTLLAGLDEVAATAGEDE